MDDGIELNFAVSSGPKVVSAPKGGRWTDRVAAKKAARKAVRRPARAVDIPSPAAIQRQDVARPERPVPSASTVPPSPRQPTASSRHITEDIDRTVSNQSRPKANQGSDISLAHEVLYGAPAPKAGPSRIAGQHAHNAHTNASTASSSRKGKDPQFISSLFSSNPSHQPSKSTTSTVIGAPSNAPLKGDADTFPGLGLEPLLVHHLTHKMGVKAPTGIQKSALPYLLSEPLDINTNRHRSGDGEEEDDYEDGVDGGEGKEGGTETVATAGLRDVLVQSQTGSGKTLTYLLPIIQTLLPLSKLSYIDRSIGTLAIILAPTRELAQQIERVLEQLLSMALTLPDSDVQESYTRWLVSGIFTGGATKNHEKARLRKGLPIIVATPGRLLDHLQSTSSFNCGKTMFLVLDEADRLMDLGFEETITGIIKALEGRRRLAIAAEKEMDEVGGGTMRWPFWNRGRTTILCSATIDAKVEKLAGMSLRDPIVFRSRVNDDRSDGKSMVKTDLASTGINAIEMPLSTNADKFTPPSQLSQKYVVTPTKLRLVALIALLRSLVAKTEGGGNKIIVFLSSTDTVDYHWRLLGGVRMGDQSSDEDISPQTTMLTSPLIPKTAIQRLHGSLPLAIRKASLAKFTEASDSPSVLLATSVASRGLDLPLVRAVIQYDLPTEGGANEYVHRVGRTARAGKGGEAWAFVGPAEVGWVKWVEDKMGSVSEATESKNGKKAVRLGEVSVEDVLRKGFGGSGYEYEARATDVQLAFERWVLSSDSNAALARKAFASFMRAYSTHPLEEKQFFHPKSLHLGHLAKAFALRETPSSLGSAPRPSADKTQSATTGAIAAAAVKRKRDPLDSSDDEEVEQAQAAAKKGGKELTARNKTEERMYAAVRKQGRNVKSGGALGEFASKGKGGRASGGGGSGGGGEFHVMGGNEIERMLAGKS